MSHKKDNELNLAQQFRDASLEYMAHIQSTAVNLTEMVDTILKNHAPTKCPELDVKHSIPDKVSSIRGDLVIETGSLTLATIDIRQGKYLKTETLFMCIGESNNPTCDNCKIKEKGVLIK